MTSVRMASHLHSTWSYDGEWQLEAIARTFGRLRYDVVLMAEHDRTFDQRRWEEYQHACAELSTDKLLLVPGIEYEDAGNVVHTVVWGAADFLGSARPTLEILKAAREQDGVAIFAHPWRRSAFSRFKPEWAPLLSGVEIWNRRYDGVAPRRGAHLLSQYHALPPFVSLDFHSGTQFFPLAMCASIEGAPSAPVLVEAFRRGDCQPRCLGLPALRMVQGPQGAAIRAVEASRRSTRAALRPVRRAARAARTSPRVAAPGSTAGRPR